MFSAVGKKRRYWGGKGGGSSRSTRRLPTLPRILEDEEVEMEEEDEEVMDEDDGVVEIEDSVEDPESNSESEDGETEDADGDEELPEGEDGEEDSSSDSPNEQERSEEDSGSDSDSPNEQEQGEEDEDLGRDSLNEQEQGSLALAVAAAPPVAPPDVPVTTGTAVANVTVSALECRVCFLTLRPPIFQCEVGHVVCSACRDKLEATGNGKCHVCGVAMPGGYRRCHDMEQLLDCIRVPCPYAAHGCDATPPYHGQESHSRVCPHAPCHCPAGESCGFIGSTAVLLEHFAGAHDWPCTTTNVHAGETFDISLHLGFNFILLADQGRDDGEQAATTGSVQCRLFLMSVTQERLGRAISVLCIHPHASAATNGAQQLPSTQCELVFSRNGDGSSCRSRNQSSVFDVVCTDLSNGMPNPEGCFQFLVPSAFLGVGDDQNSVQVKARIIHFVEPLGVCTPRIVSEIC